MQLLTSRKTTTIHAYYLLLIHSVLRREEVRRAAYAGVSHSIYPFTRIDLVISSPFRYFYCQYVSSF